MRLLDTALVPPAPVWEDPNLDRVTIRLNLKTMTPVFGGGHTAREVDPFQAVRPSAIRGQLRYWWRATTGAQYSSTKDLYKAESALFGNTEKAGIVRVRVPRIEAGTPVSYDKRWPGNPNATRGPEERVFVFPFQPMRGDTESTKFFDSLEFTLDVVTPMTHSAEIKKALTAWLVFGGVGSRTRRGCGALGFTDASQAKLYMPPIPTSLQYGPWFSTLVESGLNVPPSWSRLLGAAIVIANPDPRGRRDAIEVWRSLGSFWCDVRKNHFPTTEFKPTDATRWPDEKNLRRLRQSDNEIELYKHLLGLPIVYQGMRGSFKGEVTSVHGGRAASPVILKPVQLSTGDIVPLIAVLRTPLERESTVQVNKRPVRVKFTGEHPTNIAIKNAASKENGFNSPIHIIRLGKPNV